MKIPRDTREIKNRADEIKSGNAKQVKDGRARRQRAMDRHPRRVGAIRHGQVARVVFDRKTLAFCTVRPLENLH